MRYLVEDVVEEVLAEVGSDVGAGVAVEDGEEADLVAVVELPELGDVAVLHAVRHPALHQVEPVRDLAPPRRRPGPARASPRLARRLRLHRQVAAALLLSELAAREHSQSVLPHLCKDLIRSYLELLQGRHRSPISLIKLAELFFTVAGGAGISAALVYLAVSSVYLYRGTDERCGRWSCECRGAAPGDTYALRRRRGGASSEHLAATPVKWLGAGRSLAVHTLTESRAWIASCDITGEKREGERVS